MKKVTIIGAGNVGATAGLMLAMKAAADIVLIDVDESLARGKALDIKHTVPILGASVNISVIGTGDYSLSESSNLIIITAGLARKPGMSRDDLLSKNMQIVASVTKNAVKYSPNAVIIVVTNPLDIMAYVALKISGFERKRVVGMAGVLDTARFISALSDESQMHVSKIKSIVLGTHGDTMVPIISHTSINDKPVSDLFSVDQIKILADKARFAGGEMVNLLKTGSAYVAPAASIVEMAMAILNNEEKELPCSCYLDGDFGFSGIFLGVPAILGKNGIEKVKHIHLSDEERDLLSKAADQVMQDTKTVDVMLQMLRE